MRRRYLLETERMKHEASLKNIYPDCSVECAHAAYALSHDDRIVSVLAEKNVLIFETGWIVSNLLNGKRVYIGRFRVMLDMSAGHPVVTWLENSCASGAVPKYNYGGFCFGYRNDLFTNLLIAGEYLACAYGMLESFAHVNPADINYVLQFYKPVEPETAREGVLSWIKSPFQSARR